MPQWEVFTSASSRKNGGAMRHLPFRRRMGLLWSLIALLSGLFVNHSFGAEAGTSGAVQTAMTTKLVCSPCAVNFGSVSVGQSKSAAIVLKNSGSRTITIASKSKYAPWVTLQGPALPAKVAPGKLVALKLVYTPQDQRQLDGALTYHSDAANRWLSVKVIGSSFSVGTLTANPAKQSFGNVQVGKTATLSQTLTNSGSSNVTISQVTAKGTAFSVSGIATPLTLAPAHSVTFHTTFAPKATGTFSGSISVASNASNASLSISEAGTGTSTGGLSTSPATLSFGTVAVGSQKTLSASLTASGASVTVKSASVNSTEYAVSGISFPLTLAAGQSVTYKVAFKPQSSGTANASLTFATGTSSSNANEVLSGTGGTATSHSVKLTWKASSSTVVGYNVYRGGHSGGPYTSVTSSPDSTTAFTDTSVQAGATYYYVVTAVDSSGHESVYSNQATAVVP